MAKVTIGSENQEQVEVRVPPALERKHGGMDAIFDTPPVYDASCLSTFQVCPRKFYYSYNEQLELPGEPLARLYGYAWHEVLAVWYRTGDLEAAVVEFDVIPAFVGNENFSKERGQSRFREYIKQYKQEPFEILETEVEFVADVPGCTALVSGRIDLVGRQQGGLRVVDHKTTKGIGASFYESFRPHLQMDTYSWVEREMAGNCWGAVINAISTAANPTVKFGRDISPRTKWELDQFPIRFKQCVEEVERCKESGVWPCHTSQCQAYYAPCQFKVLCTYGVSSGTMDRFEKKKGGSDGAKKE